MFLRLGITPGVADHRHRAAKRTPGWRLKSGWRMNGHGYTFERLRAKVLFTDRLQKRIPVQEKVKMKKQRFEDISMGRMTYFMMSGTFDDEYEVKIKTRQGNLGTDLPTLFVWLDSDNF